MAIEGSLSLIVVEAYGFTHADVIVVWAPTSAAMLLGTLMFSRLHKGSWAAHNIAAVSWVALPLGALALFRAVGQTSEDDYGIVYDRSGEAIVAFVLGLGSLLFSFALTNTLFNAILMQNLLPHQQARFQTPVQTLAAVGRGIGPYLGTLVIYSGDQQTQGLGPRLMILMAYLAIGLSIIVPSVFGDRFFRPPSPRSQLAPTKAALV